MNQENTLGSPAAIQTLLRCHYSPKALPETSRGAVPKLLGLGAIKPSQDMEHRYDTTPLGAAWVMLLCDTPCPTTAFIDSHGKTINF